MFTAILIVIIFGALLVLHNRVLGLQRRVTLLESGTPVAAPATTPATKGVRVIGAPSTSDPAAKEAATVSADQPEPKAAAGAVLASHKITLRSKAEVEQSRPAPVEDAAEQPRRPRLTFEDLFGRMLPIWAGGITLAIAGFLIVKYSIDTGLLSPAIRVLFGMLFGVGLIAGAEWARRQQERVRDPRVAQALAGAGVATLYGSVLIAGNLYALIGPGTAFIALAAVTALALGLAMRFGAPSALLGLVGGFMAPVFVGGTEPNVPLLTMYLALTVGGLSVVARAQGWAWLGYAALAGGFLWSAVLIGLAPSSAGTSLALGPYLLLLGLAMPLLAFAGRSRTRAAISATIGAVQVAALVAHGGFAPLDWALFAMISIGVQWIARQRRSLRPIRPIAFAIALLLLAAWPSPTAGLFGVALGAMLIIHGGSALFDLWRRKHGVIEAGQIAVAALAVWLLPFLHFDRAGADDLLFGLYALAGSVIAGGAAALGWSLEARKADFRFPLLVIASALCAAAAAAFALPLWLFAPALGAIACVVLAVALRGDDHRVETVARFGIGAAVATLLTLPPHEPALLYAMGMPASQEWRSIVALAVTLVAAGIFARFGRIPLARSAAQAVTALLGYATLAQSIPIRFEPLLAAGLLAALAATCLGKGRRDPTPLFPAMGALAGLVALWSLVPALLWVDAAAPSLFGMPLLVTALAGLQDVILRLAVPALGLGFAAWIVARDRSVKQRLILATLPATLLLIALHIGYKHLFAIGDAATFETLGLAERTTWEALFVGAGLLLISWRREGPFARAALVMLGVGLAHFAWFTLLLHNPLWWPQAVGSLPVLNLLLPAYLLPLAALWVVDRALSPQVPGLERAIRVARLVLILFLGCSLLRQGFQGSWLSAGQMTAWESTSYSIFILAAGVGFLLWGIARGGRDWRLASLVLMLAAAAKVFLWDAAGLEGLLRIGAFVALGFSLIGIGWLYARFVNDPALGEGEART